MGNTLVTWVRDHRMAWALGAVLWVLFAVIAVPFAGWQRAVTLDEWGVAIGLLVWVFSPFIPAPEKVGVHERPRVVRAAWWLREITWALGFLLLLDLLTRAVLGLGLTAF